MDVNIRLIKQTVFNHFADTISIKVKVLMQLLAERVGVWLLVQLCLLFCVEVVRRAACHFSAQHCCICFCQKQSAHIRNKMHPVINRFSLSLSLRENTCCVVLWHGADFRKWYSVTENRGMHIYKSSGILAFVHKHYTL